MSLAYKQFSKIARYLAANHQPPTTNHQPPTTNHQPPTTNHQPPTTNQVSIEPGADSMRTLTNAKTWKRYWERLWAFKGEP